MTFYDELRRAVDVLCDCTDEELEELRDSVINDYEMTKGNVEYTLCIMCKETDKLHHKYNGVKTKSQARLFERGINITLDHEKFYTKIYGGIK